MAARLTGQLFRFSGWFIGFAGLFAMGSVCPFCGKQGCPVGIASAGFMGIIFGSLMHWGKSIVRVISGIAKSIF
jgi:hypothetical protein